MSKIDDLISQQKEVTFRGEKFMLESGFTLEETPIIQMAFGNKDPKIKAEGMKLILKLIARRLFPDATEDKISKIDAKYTADLLDVFYQIDESTEEDIENVKKILKKGKNNEVKIDETDPKK